MKTSVYARTPTNRIWVRGTSCRSEGLIRLQHQPVIRHRLGLTKVLGLNSSFEEPFNPHSETLSTSWSEGASMSLDEEPFVSLVQSHGVSGSLEIIKGVLNHATGLFANGFGEDESEVLSWFKAPEELRFIEPSMDYKVTRAYPPLNFLEYGAVKLSVDGGAINCKFALGNEVLDVQVKQFEWVLVATTPAV